MLSKHSTTTKMVNIFHILSSRISHRGPDRESRLIFNDPINIILDFKRLAIMDVTTNGDQPFKYEIKNRSIYVMCNGEIYNFKELVKFNKLTLHSSSDCEVIIAMYVQLINVYQNETTQYDNKFTQYDNKFTQYDNKFTQYDNKFEDFITNHMHRMCNSLNSEHAFVIVDMDTTTGDYIVISSTDRYGIRPLFIEDNNDAIHVSSELQGLPMTGTVERFKPRHFGIITKCNCIIQPMKYYTYYNMDDIYLNPSTAYENHMYLSTMESTIKGTLTKAVVQRLSSDRPYGCLLSGGVDSSLVSAIAAKHLGEHNIILNTFSIGMEGGTDEYYANLVAKHIKSNHTHITVPEQSFIDAIPDVIKTIGSYDITTVRASVGQYLISQWISKNTNIKVLLCGDGSDELCGSYKYFHFAPSPEEFHKECIRLLNDIHFFDGLRVDRCISHFGIEARFPFLDHKFVDFYLSCNPKIRMPQGGVEKWLLRESFKHSGILPQEVLFRPKEAFSDGVSSEKKSWYKIIQNNLDKVYSEEDVKNSSFVHLPPVSKESLHYRKLFSEHFTSTNQSVDQTIPYFWLPKWCGNINEPSARVIELR